MYGPPGQYGNSVVWMWNGIQLVMLTLELSEAEESRVPMEARVASRKQQILRLRLRMTNSRLIPRYVQTQKSPHGAGFLHFGYRSSSRA